MLKICGIYTITNLIDGKMYVGYSSNMEKRWNTHKNFLLTNTHNNIYLQNAWNKYGEESFKFEILMECEKEMMTSQEHYWCYWLNVHDRNFGYNIRPTHPENSYRLSIESRQKIGDAQRGKKYTRERVEKALASRRYTIEKRGYGMSEETKQKMRAAKLGKRSKLSLTSLIEKVEQEQLKIQNKDLKNILKTIEIIKKEERKSKFPKKEKSSQDKYPSEEPADLYNLGIISTEEIPLEFLDIS